MTKIITLVMLGLMLVNAQIAFAKQKDTLAQPSNTTSSYDVDENFTFDENSYYVSDQQVDEAQNNGKLENTKTFDDKVVNSSHFSSKTATRTWMPFNRIK